MLLRVAIAPEQDAFVDNNDTFRVRAATVSGTLSTGGNGTIVDDGTGDVFLATNLTGLPNISTDGGFPVIDDDRQMTVSDVTTNEASHYAVFTVTGKELQKAVLSITNVTTTGLTAIQYLVGTTWTNYDGVYAELPTNGDATLAESTTLLVRVVTTPEQDLPLEVSETYTLVAATTSNTLSTGGTGTILDDFRGEIFLADNKTATPNLSTDAGYPVLDDDRALSVSSLSVNENSPYAVFTVTGIEGQRMIPSITNTDTENLVTIQYFLGGSWQTFTTGYITLPTNGAVLNGEPQTLLVRVALPPEKDDIYEAGEDFTLVASTASGKPSTGGVGTIYDDGTGSIFLGTNNTSTPNTPAEYGAEGIELDDDRAEIVVLDGLGNDLVDGSATVHIGSASECFNSSVTFTITNIGAAPLVITSYTLSSGDVARFSVPTLVTPVSLDPTESTTLTVSFSTTAEGPYSATLQIINNDGNETPFDITVTGTGVDTHFDEVLTSGAPAWTASSYIATDHFFQPVLGFAPAAGQVITLLNNTGGSPVQGTFNGVPQGSVVELSFEGVTYYFKINYAGGDGNDITLTRIEPLGPRMWTWRSGTSARNVKGKYASADGSPLNPGARQGAMNFQGPDGNLWVFGGYGYATSNTTPRWLNDLWRYSPATGEWTFIKGATTHNALGVYGTKGVEDAGNMPGARHTGATWVDCNGKFWLFGGFGPTGRYNDLWKYDPATGHWTWMAGSNLPGDLGSYGTRGVPATSNIPRARQGAVAWATRCSLYLFGGTVDGTSSFLNDLWRYDIYTGEWTWLSGAPGTLNSNGQFGDQGTPHVDNVPSARRIAQGWLAQDNNNLWLFGGQGVGSSGTQAGDLNDVWRYDTTQNKWEWVRGSSSINPVGDYGVKGQASAQNDPPGRGAAGTWVGADGRLWMFGGMQNFNSSQLPQDCWAFDTATRQWTWVMGTSTLFKAGQYGTLNERAPDNIPGSRFSPSIWRAPSGTVWFYGGGGVDARGTGGRLSDIFSFDAEMPADVTPESAPEVMAFDDSSYIINFAPSTTDSNQVTPMYTPVGGTLSASDPDGDLTQFLPVGGTVTAAGTLVLQENGQWLYTPAPGFTGTGSFTFQAVDSYGGTSPVRNIKVTVINNFADSDGDGIDDEFERRTWGDLAAGDPQGDSDDDGQANYMEFMAGTDPLDGGSRLNSGLALSPGTSSSGSFRFEINHVRPGVNYHLESSVDLVNWQRIGTFSFPEAGAAVIEDADTPTGTRFYRMNLEWLNNVPVP